MLTTWGHQNDFGARHQLTGSAHCGRTTREYTSALSTHTLWQPYTTTPSLGLMHMRFEAFCMGKLTIRQACLTHAPKP